jgi:hypothetical protein
MNEMTLAGLLRAGDSYYAHNEADYLIVVVEGNAPSPEKIINPKENFAAKLEYYAKAYNEDLTLKNAPHIKIVNYGFVTRTELVTYYI